MGATDNKENAKNLFGENYLENYIVKFLWGKIKPWRAAVLSIDAVYQFFMQIRWWKFYNLLAWFHVNYIHQGLFY